MAVITSSLSLPSLNKVSKETTQNLTSASKSLNNINQMMFKRTKIKRDIFSQFKVEREKREENERRQQREDEIEATTTVIRPDGPQQLAQADTSKGFFERIFGFLGYLTAGWIMNNLPTWIAMGKEFIARLQKAGQIVSGFFNNTIKLFGNVSNIIGAVGENLLKLDFFDTSNRVKKAFAELNSTVGDIGNQVEEGLGLITTPLTEGKYSGEKIPEVGTQQTDQGAYTDSGSYADSGSYEISQETTTSGRVSPQAVYAYMRQKGISHNHAMGILAGIHGESKFEIGVREKGHSKQGVGLFQYTDPSRKQPFLSAVPNYKTNWKGQVDYALFKDPETKGYLSRQFSTPEEAAERWLVQWERPLKSLLPTRRTEYKQFIASFKPGTSSQQQTGTQGQSNQVSSGTISAPQGFRPTFIQGTTGKSTGPHFHFGPGTASNKKAQQGNKFPGLFYSDTRDVAFNVAKYFLGQKKSFLLSRSGRWISPGITDSQLKNAIMTEQQVHTQKGSDGGIDMAFADNVKLPLAVSEVSDRRDGFGISGTISGTNVFVGHGAPGSTSSSSGNVVSQAQMSPSPQSSQQRQGVPSAITPERKRQNIIVAQPSNKQNIITTPSGGGGQQMSSTISDFDLLNNFMKNKLLLDLAYL
jgi:hypothetical protein